MKAVVRTEYGDTSVLRVEDVPEPVPDEGEVIVDVAAAGVNMAEWHMMSGQPTLVRAFIGLRRPKRAVLGRDVAGIVSAVGTGVTRLRIGDVVFGSGRGAWAQKVSAQEANLQPVPAGISLEQAATVPMSGYTALQALRVVGPLDGTRVAITGAGGGVGSIAIQLAAARGAHVTAICSAGKHAFVRDLGAHDVIDYRKTDPTHGGARFDAVLDFAGGLPLTDWRRVITPEACWCSEATRTAARCSVHCRDHCGHGSPVVCDRSPSWPPPHPKTSPNWPQRSPPARCVQRTHVRSPSPRPRKPWMPFERQPIRARSLSYLIRQHPLENLRLAI